MAIALLWPKILTPTSPVCCKPEQLLSPASLRQQHIEKNSQLLLKFCAAIAPTPMTITLSQQDHQDLFDESQHRSQSDDTESCDVVVPYPEQLGQGSTREIQLREGMVLEIANFRLHQDVTLEVPERSHPLEFEFSVVREYPRQRTGSDLEDYFFSGSGMAARKFCQYLAGTEVLDVSFHLEPTVFCNWMGDRLMKAPLCVQQLVRATHQGRHTQSMPMPLAMRTTVQQILQCPYSGLTQQIYLESKVWELMALHMEQVLNTHPGDRDASRIKPDDLERLHHAKEILRNQLSDPPSLNSLARQVGLNEFILKQGFRSVFGTTVFGCLHHYRMEYARELLADGGFNVSEVARQVGFTNRGHFAAAFRKKFGTNPKAYAQAIQQQSE